MVAAFLRALKRSAVVTTVGLTSVTGVMALHKSAGLGRNRLVS